MLDNMTLAELYDLVISSPKGGALLAMMAGLGTSFFIILDGMITLIHDFVVPKVKSLWRRWREKRKADKS